MPALSFPYVEGESIIFGTIYGRSYYSHWLSWLNAPSMAREQE